MTEPVHFAVPYRIAADGRTAGASLDEHVRDLIGLVLFTYPGERVNRPDFGSGLKQLVFAENAPELANATQHLVQSSLQRWLSDLIEVRAVDVKSSDSALTVLVQFRALETDEVRVVKLVREA
ncbi:GPW/gp25 family protein [Rhizobium terrae]|uniref:GPW/gp25 family protein n=1 Tax=Rhizobium terrae TaxID=2171756 RepID=UPI000E3DB0D0|nr:GPW/gp25 family protein [Rhizobium terrae]